MKHHIIEKSTALWYYLFGNLDRKNWEVLYLAADNKQYKDRLFNFLFGSEENKAWTLSLYNAVNGSSYTNPDAIQITTIKEVMYLGMHNDVSFLIAEDMALYEQQSTYNPNMPLRMLQYTGFCLFLKLFCRVHIVCQDRTDTLIFVLTPFCAYA